MSELKEYFKFIRTPDLKVAKSVFESISPKIQNSLNPPIWKVIAKISIIHLFSSILTLSLCPQFGVRSFGEGEGLMLYFMKLGHHACYVLCGVFYLSVTVFLLAFLLHIPEWKKLKQNIWIQIPLLSMLSMGVFIMAGAQVSIDIGILWFLGAVMGSKMTVVGLDYIPIDKRNFLHEI